MADVSKLKTGANGTVYNIRDDSAVHTVDSSMSSTSVNPVQNKVIKGELDKKKYVVNLGTLTATSIGGNQYSISGITSTMVSGINAMSAPYDVAFTTTIGSTLLDFCGSYNGDETINGGTYHMYTGTVKDGSGNINTFNFGVLSTGTAGLLTVVYVENTANKVTSISGSSTDVQYPSAKLLYDSLQDVYNAIPTSDDYVDLTTDQTIDGVKTFLQRPLSTERYTRLEYIASDYNGSNAYPYILTGVLRGQQWTSKLTCVLDGYFSMTNVHGFCGYDSGGQLGQSNGKWSTETGVSSVNCVGVANRATVTQEINFSTNKDTLYINGSQIAQRATGSVGSYAQTYEYPLFVAANSSGYVYRPASLVLYSFKMYDDNDTLIRDFTPAMMGSRIGLYDSVTNAFFPNVGTGTFTAGPSTGNIDVTGRLLVSTDVGAVALTNLYGDLDNLPKLSTTSATALPTSANETIQNTVSLHKIAKTGNYNDLLNKPTIPEAELFECERGVTTYDEVSQAIADGKFPYVEVNGVRQFFVLNSGTGIYFAGVDDGGRSVVTEVSPSDEWTDYSYSYQPLHQQVVVFVDDTYTWSSIYFEVLDGNLPVYLDATHNVLCYLKYTDSSYTLHWIGEDDTNYYEITLANDNTWSSVAVSPKSNAVVFEGTVSSGSSFPKNITLSNGATPDEIREAIGEHKDVYLNITFDGDIIRLRYVGGQDIRMTPYHGDFQFLSTMRPTYLRDDYVAELLYTDSELTGTTSYTFSLELANVESTSNKVTSITSSSTNTQYPSAKAVYDMVNNLPTPMQFKGTVGTGGTIEWSALPSASGSNGFTYKVISDHTGSAPVCKVGDTIVSNNTTWVVIPSGDEPSGTVTSVGIANGNSGISVSGGPITTSGTLTVSHGDTSNVQNTANTGRTYVQNVEFDDFGHVTKIESATETATDDHKVTQVAVPSSTPEPTANPYNVLIGYSDGGAQETNFVRKSTITYNPTSKALVTGGTVNGYTLNAASAKDVDSSISAGSTSTKLPTSQAVASFVEGKGYVTTDTTYSFADGVNGFTVTPNVNGVAGQAIPVTVTPSIANNIVGSGTSGYLAKFDGANTITNGPQLGNSTTTYLRNDGTWATPDAPNDPYMSFAIQNSTFRFMYFNSVPTTYSDLLDSDEFRRALTSPIMVHLSSSFGLASLITQATLFNIQGLGDASDGDEWTLLFADAVDMGSAGNPYYVNGVKGTMTYDTTNTVWYLANTSYNVPASALIAANVADSAVAAITLDVLGDASKTVTGKSFSGGQLTLTTSDIAITSDQVTGATSSGTLNGADIAIFDATDDELYKSGLTFDTSLPDNSEMYLSQYGTWEPIPTVPSDIITGTGTSGSIAQFDTSNTVTSGPAFDANDTTTHLRHDGTWTNTAYRTSGIPYGQVASTSTATAYTATIDGITDLHDGVCMWLKNGVVTSAEGFTLNINGLGAKPCYTNLAAATRDTTIFNVNYTMLFVYDSTRVSGGCWVCYRGYDSNTNTIGYQLRTNSMSLPVSGATYRYRLLFTSADGTKYVPANTSTSTNATSARAVNQTPIDPFGDIRYYSSTTAVSSGSRPSTTTLWQQYTLTLGYSFNRTGAALTLTSWKPVYVKCAPQADGSAIMDADAPFVQALPTTADGKIYIFLGVAYSATAIELLATHPVYYYKNNGIREWTGQDIGDLIPTKTSDLTNDGSDGTHPFTSSNEFSDVTASKATQGTAVSLYKSGGVVTQTSYGSSKGFTVAEGTVTANSVYSSGGVVTQTSFSSESVTPYTFADVVASKFTQSST